MQVTVEISYYPLSDHYKKSVVDFLDQLSKSTDVTVTTGIMSTVVMGEYDEVMNTLAVMIKPFLDMYPSIFILKVANACKP